MDKVIQASIDRSISYQEYRDLVKKLSDENSTSGAEKTESLAEYTKLNNKRMKRWDKTIKVSEEAKAKIASFNKSTTWLIITESWCGDAAHVIPVINRVAELNPNINIRIVLRDDNLELIDMFLTNGGRAIAKVIMLDNITGEVVDTYGPRPSEATNLVNEYKAKHGKLTPEFKEDLQMWYNKNKGQNIIDDMIEVLNKI